MQFWCFRRILISFSNDTGNINLNVSEKSSDPSFIMSFENECRVPQSSLGRGYSCPGVPPHLGLGTPTPRTWGPVTGAGASLRIRFHLTHRASDFIKSLAQMKFHPPRKYFVKTYIHLFLLFNTNILYSLLLINMKCFLILLNIFDLQIFFCFFISVSTTDKINFGFVISVTFDI